MTRLHWPALATCVLTLSAASHALALPPAPVSDTPVVAAPSPDSQRLLDYTRENEPQTLADQVALCEIPAPPFKEQRRAEAFKDRLSAIGLESVRIDAKGNVLGEWAGRNATPVVVLSAHLDTVFPEGTDVSVARKGAILKGPGIVDDCRGLAVVLGAARAIVDNAVRPDGHMIFVATVGEEGPGNLRGVRHLFEVELKDRVDYFISVDGAGDSLTHDAVGSNRYEVTYQGPGGHSLHAFGMPNPMHALGRAIAKIADFEVPSDPRVTFAVSLLEGGTSINSIPHEASMGVDMRSADPAALGRLDTRFHAAVEAALAEEKQRWQSDVELSVTVESIGVRPAGWQPADAPIVVAAVEAGRAAGIEPHLEAGSTDSNIPISLGVPAVTIDGGGKGQGAHSPATETFDTTDSHRGTQWALLLTLALANTGAPSP